jgi:hypothetical protein
MYAIQPLGVGSPDGHKSLGAVGRFIQADGTHPNDRRVVIRNFNIKIKPALVIAAIIGSRIEIAGIGAAVLSAGVHPTLAGIRRSIDADPAVIIGLGIADQPGIDQVGSGWCDGYLSAKFFCLIKVGGDVPALILSSQFSPPSVDL